MVMRRFPAGRLIAALLWAGAWSSCGSVEIYKWVDQKGVTNYSGAPPATGKARTLDPEATTVSVYPAPAPQDTARAPDAVMRHRVAMLEDQLRAERLSRQAAHQTDADRTRLAYEQCLSERRVDCDSGRDGMHATPYFYAAAAPVFVIKRPFAFTPNAPFTRTPPFGSMARFARPPVRSTRTTDRLSRKFR